MVRVLEPSGRTSHAFRLQADELKSDVCSVLDKSGRGRLGSRSVRRPRRPRSAESVRRCVIVSLVLFFFGYMGWRISCTFNPHYAVFSILFIVADFMAGFSTIGLAVSLWHLRGAEKPPEPPGDLKVDVWIPTHNEHVDILRRTIHCCVTMEYPHVTYVLDDGNRPEVRALAEDLGARYIGRESNTHGKAGNLNNALKRTNGDFIAVFDADFIPARHFLTRLLGYFTDPKIALVQAPQHYYNVNSFQHRKRFRKIWNEQAAFFDLILQGRNGWNASFWIGTNAILRREAVERIGGFATESVTEDMLTSIRIHADTWRSIYVNEPLAYGLAPVNIRQFLIQRLRWSKGASQIFWRQNPLFSKGLSAMQRLCYLFSIMHFFDGIPRLVFYFLPALYLLAGVCPIARNPIAIWIILGYISFNCASLYLITGKRISFLNDELYAMIRSFTYVMGNLTAFLKRSVRFAVTPKDHEMRNMKSYVVGPALIFCVNSTALFSKGFLFLHGGLTSPIFLASMIFCTYFTVVSFIALCVSFTRPRTDSFAVYDPVSLDLSRPMDSTGHKERCLAKSWNDCGATIVSRLSYPLRSELSVRLRDGETAIADVHARVMRKAAHPAFGSPETYEYDVEFKEVPERDRLRMIGRAFQKGLMRQQVRVTCAHDVVHYPGRSVAFGRLLPLALTLVLAAFCLDSSRSFKGLFPHGVDDVVPPTGGIVAEYGNLGVKDGKLCGESGTPVRIRGVSSHGPQWFPFVKDRTVESCIDFFGIEAIRVAVYVEAFKGGSFWNGYVVQPEYMLDQANSIVRDAINAGIYAIITWHIHSDPMEYKNEAMAFFKPVASKWGSYPNVIFEICNEPEGNVPWSRVREYAIGDPRDPEDGIIDVIRKYDSDSHDNIIIVGTPFWSQRVDRVLEDPITEYGNVMYAFHFYAASHKRDVRDLAQQALDGGLPVFVSEWGTAYHLSNGPMDLDSTREWIEWMDGNGLSWINWSLSVCDETTSLLKPTSSMSGPWSDQDATPSGAFVRRELTR